MRVLYVEDNASDADLARHVLGRDPAYSLDIVTTLTLAYARLETPTNFDLLLCDLRLPDGSGLDMLAWVREHSLPLAVVILTGSGDQDMTVAALKMGANDYIIKREDYLKNLPTTLQIALARYQAEAAKAVRPLRVLYAERHEFDIDLTRRHFAQYAPHIRLEVVKDLFEALERLPTPEQAASVCDVLLLDYQLPGLNALEAVKILHDERGINLPLVLVTGHGNEEVAAQAMRLGFADYLVKQTGYLFQLPMTLENAFHRAELAREQASLKRSQTRYEELVTRIPVGIYRFRKPRVGDWIFDYASPRFCQMLGVTQEALLADVNLGFAQVHLDELPAFIQHNEMAWKNGTALVWEGRFVIHDEVRWLHIDSTPTLLDNGDTVWDGVVMDVTERRQAEEQLRLSATVFASTQDGVVITDTTPRILAVNRAYQEITGYSEEEAVGKNPSILQSGRHDRPFYQALWANILHTGHWQGEIWNRRKNGEIYPQLTSISEVRDDQDKVTNFVGVFTDISQIKQTEAQLVHLAHYDPLTDLPNRLLFQSRMEHALESALRHEQHVALLLIDLDRFKDVNDSLGHTAGDELLQQVTARMRQRLRGEDTLARIGGDEFVIIMEQLANPEDAGRLAQEIIDSLTQSFRLNSGAEVSISASIGISIYPQQGETHGELTQHADAALYLAKGEGRHTYRYYTDALTQASQQRLSLETRLRRAVEHDEFIVYYQPLIDISSGRIIGAEALVRWMDPQVGMIMPDQFIPVAEESGLIVALGETVLRAACLQAKTWSEMGFPALHLAVNLSPRQFAHPDLAGQILSILNETGFDPKKLVLELTEGALMSDGDKSVALLNTLKAAGIQLAIDDFGTGYSSLSYLRRFPLDTLKIDKSFVREIPQNREDGEIAIAIIQLAHTLGFTVLAEGVESKEQLAFVTHQKCDLYQGYFFSRPIPGHEFIQLLGLPNDPGLATNKGL